MCRCVVVREMNVSVHVCLCVRDASEYARVYVFVRDTCKCTGVCVCV